MKTKEVKIEIPQGYEIDNEKSTLECIKFKPIKKDITYNDVAKSIMGRNQYFIHGSGKIFPTLDSLKMNCCSDKNNATNRKQLKRILALNQLLNIAEYYNALNSNKTNWLFCITLNYHTCNYVVITYNSLPTLFGVIPLFNRKEDAQAVIDNPNFREILDTIYKFKKD